jgi:hypothetical protein
MKTYWLSPKIKYKTFKLLNKKLYPKPDITPVNGDRILWKMLKKRQINIFIEESDDPLCLTLKAIPKKAKLIILTNKLK